MSNFDDDTITVEPNNETLTDDEEVIETSIDQTKKSCECFRNKTFIGIFLGIIFVITALVVFIIFMRKKKINIDTTITTTAYSIKGSFHYINITKTTKWTQNGITVIRSDRACIGSIYIDDDGDDTLYFSEYNNHRIMKWVTKTTSRQIVAGGNGPGSGTHQLSGCAAIF